MDIKEVKNIASLARIDFNENELAAMVATLNKVFSLVDQIEKFDTTDAPALAHPLEAVQRQREDTVSEADQHASLHGLAPEVAEQMYLVPKVIDEGKE